MLGELPAIVPLIAGPPQTPMADASGVSLMIELAGASVRAKASTLADLVDIFTALRRSAWGYARKLVTA